MKSPGKKHPYTSHSHIDMLSPEEEGEFSLTELSRAFFSSSFSPSTIRDSLSVFDRLFLKAFLTLADFIEKSLGFQITTKIPFALLKTLPSALTKPFQWLIAEGIIKRIFQFSSQHFPDEPQFFIYGAEVFHRRKMWPSGAGETHREALVKVIAEASERYAQSVYQQDMLTEARYTDLRGALDPLSFAGPSLAQRREPGWERWRIREDSVFRWTKGISLISGRPLWIPAQLAYLYDFMPKEPIIILPISTGAAAGISQHDAMMRGIYEVIEREAFMVTYLNRLSPPEIDFKRSGGPLRQLAERFERYHLELHVYALPTDAPVDVTLAVINDKTGIGPAIVIGAKAHHDPIEAARSAILEAYMGRVSARKRLESRSQIPKYASEIRRPEDHLLFWTPHSRIKDLNFLRGKRGKKITLIDKENRDTGPANLQKLLRFFEREKMEVFWIDLALPVFKRFGLFVGKAVIPALHPLFLDERHPYYGGKRLYELPVTLGYFKKPLREEQLNHIPHPFP